MRGLICGGLRCILRGWRAWNIYLGGGRPPHRIRACAAMIGTVGLRCIMIIHGITCLVFGNFPWKKRPALRFLRPALLFLIWRSDRLAGTLSGHEGDSSAVAPIVSAASYSSFAGVQRYQKGLRCSLAGSDLFGKAVVQMRRLRGRLPWKTADS